LRSRNNRGLTATFIRVGRTLPALPALVGLYFERPRPGLSQP